MYVIALAVLVAVGVLWALAKSAQLRGPAPRKHPSRPVESLVTELIPEEHPSEDEDEGAPPTRPYEIESEPPRLVERLGTVEARPRLRASQTPRS